MSRKVFVTGGSGFIGSHLVEELQRRGYEEIRCLVREKPRWLEGMDIVPVRGNMQDLDALRAGCSGVDMVFHVAGVTRAARAEDFEKGNVTATVNLLEAVRDVNPRVQRVVITSSLAAVGPSREGPVTEASPLVPISSYGRSKAEMEQCVRSFFADLPITVVRPPAVYGPREMDIFTYFQTVSFGICPIIGKGNKPEVSLIFVRDLVRGMVDAAVSERAVGETYFFGSEQFYSWNQVRDATLSCFARRVMTIHVPRFLVGPIGALSELVGKAMGQYPPLNREKARELKESWMCSIEKAQRELGFKEEVTLEEGIRETITWYRAKGWL